MKKSISIISLLLIVVLLGYSQAGIVPIGGAGKANNIQLSWTTGEVVSGKTGDNSSIYLIQGIQQPINQRLSVPPAEVGKAIELVIIPSSNKSNINQLEIPGVNLNDYPNNDIVIFNRWGQIIYEENPYSGNWNGQNKKGKPIIQGSYYFIFRLDKEDKEGMHGNILLLK